ncbi:hypothetical protein BJF78_14590 [Pseudonocardia sp. CNS-139]|nr:hypothetical protein BJF78_14590 [Pseudonocardia sp. CNS-139]
MGLTSLVTAYARACESRSADPLFTDPQAADFVTAALGIANDAGGLPPLGPIRADGSSVLWKVFEGYFAARTRSTTGPSPTPWPPGSRRWCCWARASTAGRSGSRSPG